MFGSEEGQDVPYGDPDELSPKKDDFNQSSRLYYFRQRFLNSTCDVMELEAYQEEFIDKFMKTHNHLPESDRDELERCIPLILYAFHFRYQFLKQPLEWRPYLNKMARIVAFNCDIAFKRSNSSSEQLEEVASSIITSLFIYLDKSIDHVLDALLLMECMTVEYKELAVLVLLRVFKDIPPVLHCTALEKFYAVEHIWIQLTKDDDHGAVVPRPRKPTRCLNHPDPTETYIKHELLKSDKLLKESTIHKTLMLHLGRQLSVNEMKRFFLKTFAEREKTLAPAKRASSSRKTKRVNSHSFKLKLKRPLKEKCQLVVPPLKRIIPGPPLDDALTPHLPFEFETLVPNSFTVSPKKTDEIAKPLKSILKLNLPSDDIEAPLLSTPEFSFELEKLSPIVTKFNDDSFSPEFLIMPDLTESTEMIDVLKEVKGDNLIDSSPVKCFVEKLMYESNNETDANSEAATFPNLVSMIEPVYQNAYPTTSSFPEDDASDFVALDAADSPKQILNQKDLSAMCDKGFDEMIIGDEERLDFSEFYGVSPQSDFCSSMPTLHYRGIECCSVNIL